MVNRRQLETVALVAVVVAAGSAVFLVDRGPAPGTAFTSRSSVVDGSSEQLAAPPTPERIRALHGRNATGTNATVGVVVVTHINTAHPTLAPRMTDVRSFGRAPTGQEAGGHGTAVALTVATVAPDADMLVATADSPGAARRAIAWLAAQDVDVLLIPATELGAPGDGTGTLASAAERAADRGALVVAPTGNLARSHWEGRLHPTRRSLHSFGETVRLPLYPPAGAGTRAGGRVQARLRWNASAYPRDLDLELYRSGPTGVSRVATSERSRTGSVRIERLDAWAHPGDLFLAVRLPNRTVRRFDPLPARIEITTRRHRLADATAAGSVASPATAAPVLAVGAAAPDGSGVAPYSSRGPTADGRRGVDLVTTPTVWSGSRQGTSAAAAYAAGVAALASGEAGDGEADPTSAQIAAALCDTATGLPPAGPDPRTGHGRLDATAALTAIDAADAPTDDSDRERTSDTPAYERC
jgi:hypothetical protein